MARSEVETIQNWKISTTHIYMTTTAPPSPAHLVDGMAGVNRIKAKIIKLYSARLACGTIEMPN